MNKISKYFILLASISIAGCGQSESGFEDRKVPQTLTIDKDKAQILKFSDLFAPPEFIPLETSNYSLVGDLSQIVFTDSTIIVVPSSFSGESGVLLFKRDGRFINSIYKMGRGPDEYLSLVYIFVDSGNKHILFYDPWYQGFVRMSFTGNIIEKTKVPGLVGYGIYIHPETGHYLLDTSPAGILSEKNGYETWQLVIFNPADNSYKPLLKTGQFDDWFSVTGFSPYRNMIYYKPSNWDTIYSVEEEEVVPRYVFDFGKYSKPKGFLTEIDSVRLAAMKSAGGFIRNHLFFKEAESYIISTHEVYRQGRILHFYNKATQTSTVYNSYINDYIGILKASQFDSGRSLPWFSYGDQLVFKYEPTELLKNYARLCESMSASELASFKQRNPHFVSLVGRLKETDNPVLALYTVRSNK